MSNRRVVVTGMGVVSPNAHGLDSYSKALKAGTSGLRNIESLKELAFACQVGGVPQGIDEVAPNYFSQDALLAMSESMIYGGIAAIDAFRDAGLNIPDRDDNFVYEDTGAILGTGVGGITTFAEKVYEKTKTGKVKRLGSTIVEQVMGSSVSAQLGGMLALGNQVTSNSAACSTGTEAVIMGAERIRAGLANRMVVGGTEGSGPWVWGGFDSMRVLARKFNDEPQRASRPMSASACGFVPGSGAGVLVIEDLETAQKRGARIYAEVLGTALNSGGMRNGGSMTAPSPDGVQRCIREAVLKAGIKTTEVDYINGHLTATFADPSEINNWSTALEAAPGRFPKINSTKSMIGHALGAAGALECVATLLQMRDGFVHGSLNCEDLHEKIQPYAEHVVTQSLDRTINVAAKASFGFGDINSCIIFKKMETKS